MFSNSFVVIYMVVYASHMQIIAGKSYDFAAYSACCFQKIIGLWVYIIYHVLIKGE